LDITTIGLLDTDSDPDTVDVAIAANDDSIRAIELILNELADAVAIGKTMTAAHQEAPQRPKRVRSRKPVLARAREERTPESGEVEQSPEQFSDTPSQEIETEPQKPE
jgi:small subunit ribosomal protein S2